MTDLKELLQFRNELHPGTDFEDRVFFKINRKKKLRKARTGLTAAAGILLFFSLLQVFRPAVRPALQTETKAPAIEKEEIPLHEDLFFSTSDHRTRYSIEPVSIRKNASGGKTAINEI